MSSIIAAAPAATLAPSGTAMPPAPAATASRGQQQATLTVCWPNIHTTSRAAVTLPRCPPWASRSPRRRRRWEHVTLPRAPAAAAPETGKVNVTA